MTEDIVQSVSSDILRLTEQVIDEIAPLTPSQLLRRFHLEAPEFMYPPLASLETRQKAIEILRSGREDAMTEITKLLRVGLDSDIYFSYANIACRLGITPPQLRYWLERDWRRQVKKRNKAAGERAREITGRIVSIGLLGFSIWLPDKWNVACEYEDEVDLEEEEQASYERWRASQKCRDLRDEYRSLRKELGGAIIPFEEFAQQERECAEQEEQRRQERVLVKRRQGFQVGYWNACPDNVEKEDPLQVEVTKFRFREPFTSLELYSAESPIGYYTDWGIRPAKALLVDGMEAVRYYCHWEGDDREPVNAQFSTYLTDGLIGWVIDCWSKLDDEASLRPLFKRIVCSFHRI